MPDFSDAVRAARDSGEWTFEPCRPGCPSGRIWRVGRTKYPSVSLTGQMLWYADTPDAALQLACLALGLPLPTSEPNTFNAGVAACIARLKELAPNESAINALQSLTRP